MVKVKYISLEDLKKINWYEFRKMIIGKGAGEIFNIVFPDDVSFEIEIRELDNEGLPSTILKSFTFDNYKLSLKEFIESSRKYSELKLPCYINLTIFYPGIDDKGDFAKTLLFDYIY